MKEQATSHLDRPIYHMEDTRRPPASKPAPLPPLNAFERFLGSIVELPFVLVVPSLLALIFAIGYGFVRTF